MKAFDVILWTELISILYYLTSSMQAQNTKSKEV